MDNKHSGMRQQDLESVQVVGEGNRSSRKHRVVSYGEFALLLILQKRKMELIGGSFMEGVEIYEGKKIGSLFDVGIH
jgi:hypothetical protein